MKNVFDILQMLNLTHLHSEQPKLLRVLAILGAKGLKANITDLDLDIFHVVVDSFLESFII